MKRRAVWIVLDSVGIGELPDAYKWGDEGSNTLKHVYESEYGFSLPNMEAMGLSSIVEGGLPNNINKEDIIGCYGKMNEVSAGKDTTTGHWEMAGLRLTVPFATFPDGFGNDIISEFKTLTGLDVLCNKPFSGTDVIKIYGEEHIKTGKPIVYTSADSVFQIAAHEKVMTLEELYDLCRIARSMLDKYSVGRVIARPFIGDCSSNFTRTPYRRDFSMPPTGETVLDKVKAAGQSTYAVGKIEDIFAGKGVMHSIHTVSNNDGIEKTINYIKEAESGLIFTNLVDFDMLYGHRNDVVGYANALREFDMRLPEIMNAMNDDDALFITADHGCDPVTPSTDHSREYVPVLCWGRKLKKGVDLGIRATYSDLGATISDFLGVDKPEFGDSFIDLIK